MQYMIKKISLSDQMLTGNHRIMYLRDRNDIYKYCKSERSDYDMTVTAYYRLYASRCDPTFDW